MFLSHTTIEKYIDEGKILIKPDFDKKDIRPVGLRIHLAKDILIPEPGQTVDLQDPKELAYTEVDLVQEEFYLEPGAFVLGSTYESIQTPRDILPLLDGRSTIARLGITTHVTASAIDGTFEAPFAPVVEIKNVGNFKMRLHFKDPIAMLLFAQLSAPVVQEMQSQYRGQNKVAPPNIKFQTGKDH